MFSKLKKFLRIPGRERNLFLEALVLHLWVGLLLKLVPFRKIAELFSGQQPDILAGGEVQSLNSVPGWQSEKTEEIRRAVERAGAFSPWRNRCLVSSLAAKRMLNRRDIPSVLSLGVSRGSRGRVVAHAWLKSGNCELVRKDGDYTVLYTF